MRSYLQRWSIIKNSAKNISDEWAIDAFNNGLRCTDFVEELGRVRPKTMGELMDLANKWANGEDAASNKRARSPKEERARRGNDRKRRIETTMIMIDLSKYQLASQVRMIEGMMIEGMVIVAADIETAIETSLVPAGRCSGQGLESSSSMIKRKSRCLTDRAPCTVTSTLADEGSRTICSRTAKLSSE
jgi:hypothetical protein